MLRRHASLQNRRRQSLASRLQSFPRHGLPLEAGVEILWDEHQIPQIYAENDHDLALGLGLVQCHLRETQLYLLRYLAEGRMGELLGPLLTPVDDLIRRLDPGRAAPEILALLPQRTRDWLEAFVLGLNAYGAAQQRCPPEFRWLGLQRRSWEPLDIVRMSRVIAADVHWLLYARFLRLRRQPGWADRWQRLLQAGQGQGAAGAAVSTQLAAFFGVARSGSNAFAIAEGEGGGTWLASDPHLGFALPNTWLLLGLHAPGLDAVGLAPVGLPFVSIGRNADLAWGGTNLRSLSSDLFAVDDKDICRRERIQLRRRFLPPKTIWRRWTAVGPVISDARLWPKGPEKLALAWMGHRPSDEFTPLLDLMRATEAGALRRIFPCWSVPGLNFLAADRRGRVEHIFAATLPRRRSDYPDILRDPRDPKMRWTAGSQDCPNPAGVPQTQDAFYSTVPGSPAVEGLVVSANDRPAGSDFIGLFFSPPDRVERLRQLLRERRGPVTAAQLMAWQGDVHSARARSLARFLAKRLDDAPASAALRSALKSWSGDYTVDSQGAAAFELLLAATVKGMGRVQPFWRGTTDWGSICQFLPADLDALDIELRRRLLGRAAALAWRRWRRYPRWGDLHRLRSAHWLAAFPLLGRLLPSHQWASAGSRETPMKVAHGLVRGPHRASFGAQARFLCRVEDVDDNYCVLLGGQDGWLDSAQFDDQIPHWREGRYIPLPLSREAVLRRCRHRLELRGP